MSTAPISILLVEDSPSDAALLQELLNATGAGQFEFTHVETLEEARAQLSEARFDVLLLDLTLPDSTGRETFLRARASAPLLPIVVLTGEADEAIGLDAVRQGVQDYLLKGKADGAQTARAIRYAIERQRAETELRRAQDELELRVAERKLLEKQILDIGETERQRIGQDLHESVGGLLTGAALLSKALARRLENKEIAEASAAEEVVGRINDAISRTRAISRGLCPLGIGATGLVAELAEFAAETTKRSGLSCHFQADDGFLIRDQSVASHLYRIGQEAVNNAIRHSEARHLRIRLARTGEQLLLEVRDDGKGLPVHRPTDKGMGLRTMKYRAEVIGGQLGVESSEGRGTVVSCLVPDGTTSSRRPD